MRVDLTLDGRTELEKLRKVMFLIIDRIGFPPVGLISLEPIRGIMYIACSDPQNHIWHVDLTNATLYCELYGGAGGGGDGGGAVNTIVASRSPVSYISPTVGNNRTQCYRPLREMADFRFPAVP
jgi:hypothetical protein